MPQYSASSDSQSFDQTTSERQNFSIVQQPHRPDMVQAEVMVPDDKLHLSWLNQFWNAIVNALVQHEEPIFWQKRDRCGNVYWKGYDPISDRTVYLASDSEARIWLDQLRSFR